MNIKLIPFILIISTSNIYSQKIKSDLINLEPLNWDIMYCGNTDSGKNKPSTLYVKNETDFPIQGYWLNYHNNLVKVKFGKIAPRKTKKLNLRANEYWVFSDLNDNALGVFQTVAGINEIIINESNFKNSVKLPTSIQDKSITGTNSGGQILKEQADYDVLSYDLKLEVFPEKKFIKGKNIITAKATESISNFVFDLDSLLTIENVFLLGKSKRSRLLIETINGKHWCKLPSIIKEGNSFSIAVEYSGNPRIATHAPYQGGFSWNKTEDCQHWIATSCQIDGADLWFPCKDYQWDEPDSVKLSFTVPESLKAVSSGVLINTIKNKNQTTTFNWEVSNPINNYSIALNIAPYFELTDEYLSLYGDTINIFYWFLPENEENAKQLYPNIKNYLDFLESTIGPYPFRNEKIGIVEVPFVGMEHQTITAIGPNFSTQYPGYNYVLFHELCHEWFGNMVTAYDWNDFWIQEGLTGYVEALYEEHLQGETEYKKKLELRRRGVQNKIPLAIDSIVNSREIFGDWSYAKSVYMFHSLRYLIGKENIIKVLRLMAYPDKELEHKTNGQQCRFVTTDDLFETVENVCGKNYDWFKKVYLYSAELPLLKIQQNENGVILSWITKDNLPFNMPLELKTENGVKKIDFNNNVATVDVARDEILELDPNKWILFNIEE